MAEISQIKWTLFHFTDKHKFQWLIIIQLLFSGVFPVVAQEHPSTPNYVEEPEPYVVKGRKHVFTLAPFGLVQKIKLSYEYVLSEHTTLGVSTAVYYFLMPGVQINPFFRAYFSPKAPKGGYFQGQVGIYGHEIHADYSLFAVGPEDHWYKPFGAAGAGFGLGYQWLTGRRKVFVINMMAGLKFYPMSFSLNHPVLEDRESWYRLGPGSVFNGAIAIGFAR